MTAHAAIQAALETTPYPVTQPPIKGDQPLCLSFFEVLGQPTGYASNHPHRTRHTMQVDVWARRAIVWPELRPIIKALTDAGIRVGSWGPADYETDTRLHHMPITCYYTHDNTEMEA